MGEVKNLEKGLDGAVGGVVLGDLVLELVLLDRAPVEKPGDGGSRVALETAGQLHAAVHVAAASLAICKR